MWARVLAALLGVWLMAAPALLHYTGIARTHDHIVGPVVVACAVMAASEVLRAVRHALAVLGLWLLVAPWLLAFAAVPRWNAIVVGVALLLLSRVQGARHEHFGGGWPAIWRDAPDADAARPHAGER